MRHLPAIVFVGYGRLLALLGLRRRRTCRGHGRCQLRAGRCVRKGWVGKIWGWGEYLPAVRCCARPPSTPTAAADSCCQKLSSCSFSLDKSGKVVDRAHGGSGVSWDLAEGSPDSRVIARGGPRGRSGVGTPTQRTTGKMFHRSRVRVVFPLCVGEAGRRFFFPCGGTFRAGTEAIS